MMVPVVLLLCQVALGFVWTHNSALDRRRPRSQGTDVLWEVAVETVVFAERLAGTVVVGAGLVAVPLWTVDILRRITEKLKRDEPTTPVVRVRPEAFRAVAGAAAGDLEEASRLLTQLNRTLGEVAKEAGISPLLEATKRNDGATVAWCLGQGCDPNAAPTATKKTALHVATDPAVDVDVIRILLASDAHPDAYDTDGCTPLLDLARQYPPNNRSITKATLLLDAGADPNKGHQRYGDRPLAYAITMGKSQLAQLLLHRGADPDAVVLPPPVTTTTTTTTRSGGGGESRRPLSKKSAIDALRETGNSALAADLAPLLSRDHY